MTTSTLSGINNPVTSATTPSSSSSSSSTTGSSGSSSGLTAIGTQSIAGNFQTFLTLLTTQLKNQDPTNPLDTNQFTQQLVEFAQVEQQIQSNSQLSTLVSLQQTAQSTQALNFVGETVTVGSNAAPLSNGSASWTVTSPKPASATVNISNSSGQLVFSGTQTLQTGSNSINWNGQGSNGTQWPDGTYTISVTAQDASGQPVSVSTVTTGVVSSVDLTQNPPLLTVNGQNYTISQIQGVSHS
jgi:flagellar basal-body rod modification protein FlgD